MRKQFTFYASFWEAVKRIKDPVAKAEAYDVICEYALTGAEPDIDSLSDAAAIAFTMAKPNLDSSRQKAEAGTRGGNRSKAEAEPKQIEADAKQTASTPEANGKQTQAEPKQGEAASKSKQAVSKKEKEGKREIEKENECYTPPTPSLDDCDFSPALRAAVDDWLAYKRERREGYKPTGLKSMLTRIQQSAAEFGDAAVIEIIRDSMASGYQGIVFDRLKKGGNAGGAGRNIGESAKPKRDWGITYDV
jgi:hypothetical protein